MQSSVHSSIIYTNTYTYTHTYTYIQWNTIHPEKRMKFCHLKQHEASMNMDGLGGAYDK